MTWLNEGALFNIPSMSMTFSVLQPPMSWLNALATDNMYLIFVTEDVSHLPMSPLKVVFP